MSLTMYDLLSNIASTEPSTYSEICIGLGTACPSVGHEWAKFFQLVHEAIAQGLIDVEWKNGKLSCAQLTEEGVAYVRDNAKRKTTLFDDRELELDL